MSIVFNLARGGVDRDAHIRENEELLAEMKKRGDARFLLVRDGQIAVDSRGPVSLGFTDIEEGMAERAAYLGRSDGTPYFALDVSEGFATDAQGESGYTYQPVRSFAHTWSDEESTLAVQAVAILNWDKMAQFCERCGGVLARGAGGWHKCCPAGHMTFPRTDPAVIMAITDPCDRLLLGHNVQWAPGRVSVIAGYVEAGEPIEETVVREAFEETGIRVDHVSYVGSQPWPFPRSLMLAFEASTQDSNEDIRVDGIEMEYAHFYSRKEVIDLVCSGQMGLPSQTSVASVLIDRWLGESAAAYEPR